MAETIKLRQLQFQQELEFFYIPFLCRIFPH